MPFRPIALALLLALLLPLAACGGGGGGTDLAQVPPEPESIPLFRSWIGASGALNRAFDGMRIHWGHFDPALGDRVYTILDELGRWTAADAGTTRTLRREDTLDFDLFEQYATNGVDDPVRVSLRVEDGQPYGTTFNDVESSRFVELEPGALQPDAVGYRITRIEVTLDNATFDSPGQDRNGDGNWTDFSVFWQVYVYGYALQP